MVKEFDQFSTIDYFFFAITFFSSGAIGLYHGCKSRKRANTREEYLLGGRKMGLLPVTASLVATAVSGTAVLGQPAEVYGYGTQAWMIGAGLFVVSAIVPYTFLPVFVEIGELSSFKYLELRFSRTVRLCASFLYTVTSLSYLPVTIYVPALAFQQVTGLNVHLTAGLLTLLCVSYTAVGGIKAVVWTDVLQITFTIVASVTVAIVGVRQVGGFHKVWEAAERGGRLVFFNFNPDPTIRQSFWQYLLSLQILEIYQFGLNQTSIQRFLALSDLRKMRIAIWGLAFFFCSIFFLSQFIGIIVYATYETCDPFRAGFIRKIDQIVPHFIEHSARIFPGFTGIFIAGIFSASLSTTSSMLNTLSGIIFDDFLVNKFRNSSEATANNIVKLLVVILGIMQMLLLMVIEKMGTIFNMTAQCMTLTGASLLGMFVLGMFCRRINSKGALAGSIVTVLVILTLIIGGQYKEPDPFLPLRTDGCQLEIFNSTAFQSFNQPIEKPRNVPWIFKIHFLYHYLIGFVLNLSIGYIVSVVTGENPSMDEKLLVKFLRKKDERTTEEEDRLKTEQNESGQIFNSRRQ